MAKEANNRNTKVIGAGVGYVIGNYLLKGITFLSAPLFVRLLSTSEYGDFNTYLSYEAIIYILVGIALHSSINNAKIKYGPKLDEYVSSIVVLLLLNTCLWFLFGNALFPLYEKIFGFSRLVANVLIVHCLCSSLLQVYNVYISLTYSVKTFLKITAFNGIANIVVSVALILTFFSEDRCLGRIIGTLIPIALVGVYIIIFFFKKCCPTINISYWKFGLLYSIPIVPHGISQVVLSSFDRIMIRDIVGSDAAGIYSFAYVIYTLFRVATTSLENVWKPWVYERMNEMDYLTIKKQGSNYAFGMTLFAGGVLLASPEMIKVLGRIEYWESTKCVVPVLLGGYFSFLYTLPSLIEYYYGKTKFIAVGTMSAAAINIALNYIFIGKFGYIAAAYTTLITYMLYFVFHYILAIRVHGSAVFDTKKIFFVSLLALVMGMLTLVFEENWLIRWVLEIVLIVYFLYWGNRKIDIVSMLKKRKK